MFVSVLSTHGVFRVIILKCTLCCSVLPANAQSLGMSDLLLAAASASFWLVLMPQCLTVPYTMKTGTITTYVLLFWLLGHTKTCSTFFCTVYSCLVGLLRSVRLSLLLLRGTCAQGCLIDNVGCGFYPPTGIMRTWVRINKWKPNQDSRNTKRFKKRPTRLNN